MREGLGHELLTRFAHKYSRPRLGSATHRFVSVSRLRLSSPLLCYKMKPRKCFHICVAILCPGEDLNLHLLRDQFLRLARLPITPPGQVQKYYFIIKKKETLNQNSTPTLRIDSLYYF